MILRTANGSLMKVTKAEGQRMLQEQPFDYFYEPDGCEICITDSWTTCDVQIGTQEPMETIRMCHSCYIEKGGSEEGWDRVVDAEMKREEDKRKKERLK